MQSPGTLHYFQIDSFHLPFCGDKIRQPQQLEASLQVPLLREMHGTDEQMIREDTVRGLCDQFDIDVVHARKVASNALCILRLLHPVQQIPIHFSPLLETAALLHDIGSNVQVEKHHNYGRNLILQHKFDGFTEDQRSIIAFLIAMHRKNVKAKRVEKQLRKTNIPQAAKSTAIQLAAILRVADGLDTTHSQTTEVKAIHCEDATYLVELAGPKSKRDGNRALQKSDLWTLTFQLPLSFLIDDGQSLLPGPRWPGLKIPAQRLSKIELESTERLVDAARKIFAYQYIRMLQHESGVYHGQDIEAVHDMRVATRRMRTALKVLARYYPPEWRDAIKEELRTTTNVLGVLRDLDVFKLKFDGYLQDHSPWKLKTFKNLLQTWKFEHETAYRQVKGYLDGKTYRACVARIADYLNKFDRHLLEIPDEVLVERIDQLIPSMIYDLDKRVRVYDHPTYMATLDQLHRLRIQLKHFRYTLEYFESVLGRSTETFIPEIINLQDQLGDLHDADFALRFAEKEIDDSDPDQIHNRAVLQYVNFLREEVNNLERSFALAWSKYHRAENRESLASIVAVL